MNARDRIEIAKQRVVQGIAAGRMAHAYLIVGKPDTCKTFANFLLEQLVCGAGDADDAERRRVCGWIENREHPDMIWVDPKSKSRVIIKEQVKELNVKIAQTAYLGGWKAGVIIDADRMNPASANAFLKTLEEPPQKSMLLLLSSHPDELLPTIRSRCQTIALREEESPPAAEWGEQLLDILRAGHPSDPLHAIKSANRLQGLLDREKEKAIDAAEELAADAKKADAEVWAARISAQVIAVRHDIMKCFVMWHRDVLLCTVDSDPELLHFPGEIDRLRAQSEGLGSAAAVRIVEEAENLAARLELNTPDNLIFKDALLSQAALAYRARASS